MKKLRQRTLISAIFLTATTCGVAIQTTTPAAAQGSFFQDVNGYQNGFTDNAITTIRDPYVPGVMLTQPYSAPVVMPPPPPPGSGDMPPFVTPGQTGAPPGVVSNMFPPDEPLSGNNAGFPPSNFQMPLLAPDDRDQRNAVLAPYLAPPPSAQGDIPNSLQPPQGSSPSALQIDVPDDGILTDQGMPTTRTGYQSTQDFGIHKQNTSFNSDFGVRPSQNPAAYQGRSPNQTLVGIRLEQYPGTMGQVNNTAPNKPGAFKVIAGGANDAVPGTGTRTTWPNNGGTWMGTNYGNSLSPANGYVNANPSFSPISYTPPNAGNTSVAGNTLSNDIQPPPQGSFYNGDNSTNTPLTGVQQTFTPYPDGGIQFGGNGNVASAGSGAGVGSGMGSGSSTGTGAGSGSQVSFEN